MRFSFLLLAALLLTACQKDPKPFPQDLSEPPPSSETITLGAGCFWCTEAVYQQIEGVHSVISGYMGGHVENPTYEQINTKTTGHVEVVQVIYDPQKIPTDELLTWFWKLHDPTQIDGQGADLGPQYRSAIFHHSPQQKEIAEASKIEAQKSFSEPITTTIEPAQTFYPAENNHQDFYFLNRNHPYSRGVIAPKLEKLDL